MSRSKLFLATQEVVAFSNDEMDLIEELSLRTCAFVEKRLRKHERLMGRDRLSTVRDGIMGEWAVADALGLSRIERPAGRHLYSVVYGDGVTRTLDVTTAIVGAERLMVPAHKKLRSDYLVLCVRRPAPNEVRIVGAISHGRFLRDHAVADFGYGATRYVQASKLDSWIARKGEWEAVHQASLL